MRRRRFRKPAVNMSLFPFLAVLVCTMGALIVLLVTMVQQARVHASDVTQRRAEEQNAQQVEREEALRLEHQDSVWRREVLEQQRSELTGQLADRRLQLSHLEDHIRRLEKRWKQLEQQAGELKRLGEQHSQGAAESQDELTQLQAAIDAARVELENAREKLAQQPQSFAIIPYDGPNGTRRRPVYLECTEFGIVLQPEGILFRAEDFEGPLGPGNPLDAALRTTREYLTQTGLTRQQGEPYPLLVVRPDGAVAYAVARAAMKSWDDEFGYELVEADMDLEFPPPDLALREELRRTVRDARQRQAALAAAMPSQFRGQQQGGFVASPTRGGFVPMSNSPQLGPSGSGSSGSHGTADRRPRFPDEGMGDRPIGGGARRRPFTPPGEEPLAAEQTSGRPSGRQQSGNSTSGGAASGGQGQGAAPPLAGMRGRNWALPKATANATEITRPIQVACLADQLVLLPERGDHRRARVIAANGELLEVIDEFVSAVWEHMDQWGIAVAGGYWKPILHIDVGAGAEHRFEELQSLLEESGIEVKRKVR